MFVFSSSLFIFIPILPLLFSSQFCPDDESRFRLETSTIKYEHCGISEIHSENYVYYRFIGDHVLYLVLYVDDTLLIENDREIIQDVKTQFSSKFDMKDLGATNVIFGMESK